MLCTCCRISTSATYTLDISRILVVGLFCNIKDCNVKDKHNLKLERLHNIVRDGCIKNGESVHVFPRKIDCLAFGLTITIS